MFLDRLHKAFRVTVQNKGGMEADGGAAISYINVRQAEAALSAADATLSESQKRIYILRGFGQRLPQTSNLAPHNSTGSSAVTSKAEVYRMMSRSIAVLCPSLGIPDTTTTRQSQIFGTTVSSATGSSDGTIVPRVWTAADNLQQLVKDRVAELVEQGITVPTDVFMRRLAATGVTKYARMWQPDVGIENIVRESGLDAVRHKASGGALEEFLDTHEPAARAGPSTSSIGHERRRSVSGSRLPELHMQESPTLERYNEHLKRGQVVLELSVGYPLLALQTWLSLPM